MKGKFIMIDGIDGSGKSTIMNMWQEILEAQGKKLFLLKDFWQENGRHPRADEIPDDTYAIISAEPTYVWTGAAVRYEMVQNGTDYSPLAIATGFALQRLVLYKRVLLPALERGIHILQDRGVSTSLCYQSQAPLNIEIVAGLEGNAFALEHAPDVLMLMDITPERCMERLSGRKEKDDNAIFEKLDLQKQFATCYTSGEFTQLFISRGTQIERFNSDQELAILKPQLESLLTKFL